jgi:hypothetical protein
MLRWMIRPIMVVAAVIAAWFVACDAANFSIVQMVVTLVLIIALVSLAALWETLVERLKDRKLLVHRRGADR